MPYNNTPIQPPTEFTGSVSLPLARVKKIIAVDDDIASCSNNAAFVITVATEMFVQHLVERAHDVVKSERKPRRNIQYKDVANAVARIDNLEFLSDVVPRTQSFKSFKEGQAKRAAAQAQTQTVQVSASPSLSVGLGRPQSSAGDAQMQDVQQSIPMAQGQHYQQLSQHGAYGQQLAMPNGPPVLAPSPAMTNGHHSHSRNHSLEHQNILHPQPPPGPG